MLWLCIHLPNFSLDVALRGLAETVETAPLVISDKAAGKMFVHACNETARAQGVELNMPLSAAQALVPQLQVKARNIENETAALQQLAAWSYQFTSHVSIEAPHALLLEIKGSLRLFKGLDNLIERIRNGLRALGYNSVLSCAPTPLGALLLARSGRSMAVLNDAALARRLGALPLSVLQWPDATLQSLRNIGINTIGQCLQLPRAGLARRFGTHIVKDLDRALGKIPHPRQFFIPPEKFKTKLELPADVWESEALLFVARRLLLELHGFLTARCAVVQRLEFTFVHADAPPTKMMLGLVKPNRDPGHLSHLLRELLQKITLPQPAQWITLRADQILPQADQNFDLFLEPSQNKESWVNLIERLQARLGTEAVQSLTVHQDHRPEFAWRPSKFEKKAAAGHFAKRPLWLLPQPKELPVQERLTVETPSERIESGWWDEHGIARDYFVAKNNRGAKFWIFRERYGRQRWFLHGLFS